MATSPIEDIMFYANCDPHEPICQLITANNREFIRFIDAVHEMHPEVVDWDVPMARLAGLTGTSVTQTEHAFVNKHVLDALPQFKQLCLSLGHLDKQHLYAACGDLFSLATELYSELDQRLTAFLTPRREHQVLPSVRVIKKRVKQWLDELIPPAPEPPGLEEKLTFSHDAHGTTLFGQFSPALGQELHEIIRTAAAANNITFAEALVGLLRGAITAKVVFHLYETDEGVFLNDEPLPAEDIAQWRMRGTHSYRPDARLRAFIQGRDGTCRFPGCHVPARRCDIDYVIPFPKGPTSPDNLHCLCRHHHNLKTEQRVHPTLYPDGSVMWTFPAGPLAAMQAA
ncbi:HNH endonuclease signature motif containing protein [Staphylococcus chromogenes]|nr:HNH endonuclease signature motif containing protein [Staphylococcus chromogenes]